MENDYEKKSIRDNFLERRRLALQIANLNAAGRVVAVDMRKGQNEMRRRLQKYRDRQNEISEKKDGQQQVTMDEFLDRQMRLQKLKSSMNSRPFSSPLIQRMSKLINESDLEKDDEEFNLDGFTDRKRSRIDLRPSTAATCSSRFTDSRQCRRGTKIAAGQDVRYYEDEEIRDRGSFYTQLLSLRKQQEQERFKGISGRIDKFCGRNKQNEDSKTWRPMGSMAQYTSRKYNKSWVKPVRPASSRPSSGRGTWDGRTRVSTAPSTKTAWAEHNRIPELTADEMQHLWEVSTTCN